MPRPSGHAAAAHLVGARQAAILANLGDALQAAALKALHKVAPARGALHGAGPVMGAGSHDRRIPQACPLIQARLKHLPTHPVLSLILTFLVSLSHIWLMPLKNHILAFLAFNSKPSWWLVSRPGGKSIWALGPHSFLRECSSLPAEGVRACVSVSRPDMPRTPVHEHR